MDHRAFLVTMQTNRDKAREQFEEAQRKRNQELKAEAILKLENAMAKTFSRALKTQTAQVLNDVQQPLFNKDIDKYFATDEHSAASLSSEGKSTRKTLTQKAFERTKTGIYQALMKKVTLKHIRQFNLSVDTQEKFLIEPLLAKLKKQAQGAKTVIFSKKSRAGSKR